MDSPIYLALAALTVLLSLNLMLTFKLYHLIGDTQKLARARNPEPGEILYDVPGFNDTAMVLVFLDHRCPKCVAKIPELEKLSIKSGQVNVPLYLTGTGKLKHLKQMLNHTELAEQTLELNANHLYQLNPFKASPHYLFIDEQKKLQASGLIGDANWQSFTQQMTQMHSSLQHQEAA